MTIDEDGNESIPTFRERFNELFAKRPPCEWSRADYESLGYWDDWIDRYLATAKVGGKGWCGPSEISDDEIQWNTFYREQRHADRWPWPDVTDPDEVECFTLESRDMPDADLMLKLHLEALRGHIPNLKHAQAFWIIANELEARGLAPMWRPVKFHRIFFEAKSEAVEAVKAKEKSRPGRKPTWTSVAIKRL